MNISSDSYFLLPFPGVSSNRGGYMASLDFHMNPDSTKQPNLNKTDQKVSQMAQHTNKRLKVIRTNEADEN